jgi:hypothetical protein
MPAVEQDPQLVALTAERDRAELQRTALMVDRDTFYRLVQEADRLAADVDVRVRHGVAAKGEQAAARKAQTDSQAVHHRTIVDIDDLTAMMDRVDLQIAERRAVVQGEHDHRLAREVEEAAFAAADSLFSAMAQMTRLRRALHASGIGAWWVMKTLNADDDRSTGRQFLQQCMEHGWMPEENR